MNSSRSQRGNNERRDFSWDLNKSFVDRLMMLECARCSGKSKERVQRTTLASQIEDWGKNHRLAPGVFGVWRTIAPIAALACRRSWTVFCVFEKEAFGVEMVGGPVKKRQRQEPEDDFPKLRMPPLPQGHLFQEAREPHDGLVDASDFRALSDNLRRWHRGLSQLPVAIQEDIGYTAEHMEYMCQWSDSVPQQMLFRESGTGSLNPTRKFSDALCRFTAMMLSYRLRHDDAMQDVALDICLLVLPLSLLNWVTSDMDQFANQLQKSAWVSKMRLALDAFWCLHWRRHL